MLPTLTCSLGPYWKGKSCASPKENGMLWSGVASDTCLPSPMNTGRLMASMMTDLAWLTCARLNRWNGGVGSHFDIEDDIFCHILADTSSQSSSSPFHKHTSLSNYYQNQIIPSRHRKARVGVWGTRMGSLGSRLVSSLSGVLLGVCFNECNFIQNHW